MDKISINEKIPYRISIVLFGSLFLSSLFFSVLFHNQTSYNTTTEKIVSFLVLATIVSGILLILSINHKQYISITSDGLEIPVSCFTNKTCLVSFKEIRSFEKVQGGYAAGGFIRITKAKGITIISKLAVMSNANYHRILTVLHEQTGL